MNILILDNDECLGYFANMSGIYNLFGVHYKNKGMEFKDPYRKKLDEIFIDFACDLLDAGFARPYLGKFFAELKQMKKDKMLDKVIMYTSAPRSPPGYQRYIDWPYFLRRIFEKYGERHCDNDEIKNVEIYDVDISGPADEKAKTTPHGATYKNVGYALNRVGVKMEDVANIAFLDDKTENIQCLLNCEAVRLEMVSVKPYFYLPKFKDILNPFRSYEIAINTLGMKLDKLDLINEYRVDSEDFRKAGIPIGGPHKDDTFY